ncbi:MAG: hypothetical protein ACOX7N_04475 [Lawsonibacter sp.]
MRYSIAGKQERFYIEKGLKKGTKEMKKVRLIAFALSISVLATGMLTSCGNGNSTSSGGTSSGNSSSEEKVVFKLGHVNGMDSVQQKWGNLSGAQFLLC